MEQTAKQRLVEFIEYKGLKVSRFEKECGLSNSYINKLKADIGSGQLARIFERFPELNKEWLLTGEGTMLKIRTYESPEQEKVMSSEWYITLLKEYNKLKEENEELKKRIDDLLEMLKNALAVKSRE